MIGKAHPISHTASLVDYTLKENKNCLILKHNHCSGMSGKEINSEFETFQQYNDRCKKNTLSIVLSPETKDGKGLTNMQMVDVTNRFMDKMGLSEHQYIAVLHRDKDHKHIHIIANRIDFGGKAYSDKLVGLRAQDRADKVAIEMGLVRAKEVKKENEATRNNMAKEFKNEIKDIHKSVVGTRENRGLTFSEYKKLMKEEGVEIVPTINKQDKLQGFRMIYKGRNLKASEVDRKNISLKRMGISQEGEKDFIFDSPYINEYSGQIRREKAQSDHLQQLEEQKQRNIKEQLRQKQEAQERVEKPREQQEIKQKPIQDKSRDGGFSL